MTDSDQNSTFSGSIDKLRGEFDTLIEKALTQGEKALNVFGVKESLFTWSPSVDMTEDPENIFVEIDVPGMDASNLNLTLAGNILSIEGKREFPEQPEGITSHLCERKQGSFKRIIPMPSAVNPNEVSADISHGILHLTIGKAEISKPKQIVIQTKSEKKEEALQESPE